MAVGRNAQGYPRLRTGIMKKTFLILLMVLATLSVFSQQRIAIDERDILLATDTTSMYLVITPHGVIKDVHNSINTTIIDTLVRKQYINRLTGSLLNGSYRILHHNKEYTHSEGDFTNGYRERHFTYYYNNYPIYGETYDQNNLLFRSYCYNKQSELHGLYIRYSYLNNSCTVAEKGFCYKGKKEGLWELWDGQLYIITYYEKGEKQGISATYNNGTLICRELYKSNRLVKREDF